MKKEGKRKALSALVCGSMLTVALVGGTLAYLTDAEGKLSNSFTRSNSVDITLSEVAGVNGNIRFEKTIDGSNGKVIESYKYENVVPGDELTKRVTVENKDTSADAYVEVTVTLNNAGAINAAIDDFYEGKTIDGIDYMKGDAKIQAIYDEVFDGWGINYNPRPGASGVNDARGVIDGTYGLPEHVLHVDFSKTTDFDNDTTMFGINNWFMSEAEAKAAATSTYSAWLPEGGYYTSKLVDEKGTEADERDYTIVYTYYIHLPAGASTTLFEGLNIPADWNSAQLDAFDDLKIEISAKAIQAANFANAPEAFEALHGDGVKSVAPIGYQVSSDTELAAAIEAGETEIWLNSGTYHAPAAAKGNTLIINGTKDAVLEVVPAGQGEANGQLDYSFDGSTVTFNGITIKTNSQTYAGYARLSGTYNDCVIQNTYNLGTGNSAFNNCTLNITNEYLRVGGAYSATFDGCTFNTDGRAILVFQDGTSVAQAVTVKDCTFNATAAANTWNGIHVAAVSIDGSQGGTYVVNLEGTNTVDSDFNGLWQIKDGKANVTVNE